MSTQVTCDGAVVAEFSSGYDATLFAVGFYGTRAARGKVITIKRDDNDSSEE